MSIHSEAIEIRQRYDAYRKQLFPAFGSPWSKDDDETLVALIMAGRSRAEAAKIMGRTIYSVITRCQLLDLKVSRDHSIGTGYRPEYHVTPCDDRRLATQRDKRFVKALALAIKRGDHLPAGKSNGG